MFVSFKLLLPLLVMAPVVHGNEHSEEDKIKVVVVGAGASGLAAASRLSQHDEISVTVLEANDMIGGRIRNGELGGQEVPLGAQWIHGEQDNVAYEMAEELDIVDKEVIDPNDLSPVTVNEFGEVWPVNLVWDMYELIFGIYEEGEAYYKYFPEKSLGAFFIEAITYEAGQKGQAFLDKAMVMTDFFHRYIQSNEGCDSWFTDSYTGAYVLYEELPGDENVVFKDGHSFMDIINKLASDVPTGAIQTSKQVTQIDWSDGDGVAVVVNNGQDDTIKVDYVIFTGSLGFLKENNGNLFNPDLPTDKINAVDESAFGVVAKIFLLYDSEWWPSEMASFDFLFPNSTDFQYTDEEAEQDWTRWVLSVFRIAHRDNMLCAWLSGAGARSMERDSDEQVLRKITNLMRQFLNKEFPNMQDPKAILRTRWYSDPLTRGTYSYMSVDAADKGIVPGSLSFSATTGRLRFAGEATHPHHFSTVHGAIETGWREADKIIEEQGL